jgi:hypothetical protein
MDWLKMDPKLPCAICLAMGQDKPCGGNGSSGMAEIRDYVNGERGLISCTIITCSNLQGQEIFHGRIPQCDAAALDQLTSAMAARLFQCGRMHVLKKLHPQNLPP